MSFFVDTTHLIVCKTIENTAFSDDGRGGERVEEITPITKKGERITDKSRFSRLKQKTRINEINEQCVG